MDKENKSNNFNFTMPKSTKSFPKLDQEATIPSYSDFDSTQSKATEIEENTKLSIYSQTKAISNREFMERTSYLQYLPFHNIEKYIITNGPRSLSQKYFIMGVVVEKKVLAHSEKGNNKYPTKKKGAYVRFKLSDLSKYKHSLVEKVLNLKRGCFSKYSNQQQSEEEKEKNKAYELINFSQDRYKSNEFILFGKTAEAFSKTVKYGDLIAILKPNMMEQKYNRSLNLSAKQTDQIIIVGKCSNYGICKSPGCAEFLNQTKHKKCVLHIEEDNDNVFKVIKSNRPNLRSNFVDSKKIASLREHERKMKYQRLGFGFKKTRIELNDYMLTPEMKKKLKIQQEKDKGCYSKYLGKRSKKEDQLSVLCNVKCREKDYISSRNTTDFDAYEKDTSAYPKSTPGKNQEKRQKIMELDSDGESVN